MGGGLIESFSLPARDFGSSTTYHVTDSGFTAFLSAISDSLKEGGGVNQRKRVTAQNSKKRSDKKGGEKLVPLTPIHDYGLGISLLSLLSLRRGISVSKEVAFEATGHVKTSGKMRSDAWVELEGGAPHHPRTKIYLEQDMGTESTRRLVKKFFAYGDTRYLEPLKNCIILSCYSTSGTLNSARFEQTSVLRLAKAMEVLSLDDLYSYYEETLDEAALPIPRDELEKLLISVGAARRTLSGVERTEGSVFTLKDLVSYATALGLGNNRYLERFVNVRLFNQAKEKFRQLCKALYGEIIEQDYYSGFFSGALFDGYGIWVLPSTLLANSAEFYLMADGANRLMRYLNSVSDLFPDYPKYVYSPKGLSVDLTVVNYEQLPGDSVKRTQTVSVRFPHAYYSLLGGDYVCLEHLGRDVGAFFRLVALGRAVNRGNLKTDEGCGVHVIAVCDTIEDANMLARCIDPMPYENGEGGQWFRFNFLFEHTCDGTGSSILFEYNKPYNHSADYLEPYYPHGTKNKLPLSKIREILSYSVSEFS